MHRGVSLDCSGQVSTLDPNPDLTFAPLAWAVAGLGTWLLKCPSVLSAAGLSSWGALGWQLLGGRPGSGVSFETEPRRVPFLQPQDGHCTCEPLPQVVGGLRRGGPPTNLTCPKATRGSRLPAPSPTGRCFIGPLRSTGLT